jgi:Tfp pilus assembly protein PilN
MRAVNLLPRQTSARKLAVDRTLVVAVALTVLVATAVVGGFFLEKAQAATERQRMVTAQAALAKAQSQQPSSHSPAPARLTVPVVLSQEQPWHLALDAAISSRVAWDTLLRQLEYVVPSNITLTTVTLGSSGGGTTPAGGLISLGGSAFSSKDLAVFLATLARVPNVTQVALVSSTTASGSKFLTFQITAQMTLPAPPPAPGTSTTTTTGG